MGEIEESQHLLGFSLNIAFLAANLAPARPGLEEALAPLPRWHQHEILQHGHPAEFMRNLEGSDDTQVEQLLRAGGGDILFLKEDASGCRLREARYHVEDGRLACAVRADQAGYPARLQ